MAPGVRGVRGQGPVGGRGSSRSSLVTAAVAWGLLASAGPAGAYHPEDKVVRGVYIHAGDVISHGAWAPFKTPGRYVADVRRSGKASLLCDNGEGGPGSGCGGGQTVALDQREPRPVKIAGWSRAEAVGGEKGWQYSIYVDFAFADGESWPMKIAAFSTGTHDWEYTETVVTPPKALGSARVYVFLRENPGKVWFDDLFLGEPNGENLLRCPGFEAEERSDTSAREEVFRQWQQWHANAMHVYLSPGSPTWPSQLVETPYELGKSPLESFLADAARHGVGVWTTPGSRWRPMASSDDPNFPQYYCPNAPWGEDWQAVLADLARFDFAGISLVPDEYNYNNAHLKQAFAKHSDEKVREFYEKLPAYCDCPDCRRLFREGHAMELPDLHSLSPTEAYRHYINFRYETTTRWLQEAAETVKQANPACLADSLICVTPVCSDFWWGPGVAWDQVGYGSKIDFLTTDPYILLHNYLGDSTHWYVTETALRLSGGHPRHVCGVVLEPCRLREEYRELHPVEVYGAALTSVWHGAREVFYFHHVHITGRSGVAQDAEATQRNVMAAYSLLETIDPWLARARPWPGIAVLHSRASEDWWRFYCQGLKEGEEPAAPTPERPLTHPSADPRYASLAQVEPLMALLRCGLPTDLFYLDSVRAEELRDYPVILVPFPYAVDERAAGLLRELAEAGKRVVVISEVGTLTQDGRLRDRPALLDLLGLTEAPSGRRESPLAPPPEGAADETFLVYAEVRLAPGAQVISKAGDAPAMIERTLGKGTVCFLAGEFGTGLPVDYSNWRRSREERIYPPVLRPGHVAVLLQALGHSADTGRGWPQPEPLPHPGARQDDVETAFMTNGAGDLLALVINWRDEPAQATLRVPSRFVRRPHNGRRVGADGEVRTLPVQWDEAGRLGVQLMPQEVAVVRLAEGR